MARERRERDGSNRPPMDYYEYKRLHDERLRRAMTDASPAGANPLAEAAPPAEANPFAEVAPSSEVEPAHAPPKKSVLGGVKQAFAGFGSRAADEDLADVADPIDAPEEPLDDASADASDELDGLDELDELDEPDRGGNNPFADTIADVKKLGAVLKKFSRPLLKRLGQIADDVDEPTVGDDAPDEDAAPSRRARRAARKATVGLVEDADDDGDGDDETPRGRKRFSLLGSPGRASANMDDDDDDDDIAPSGGRGLFGRRVAQGDEDDAFDVGYDEDGDAAPEVRADLTRQLADALDEAPPRARRKRRARTVDAIDEVEAIDEGDMIGTDDVIGTDDMIDAGAVIDADDATDEADASKVDEHTQSFAPLRRHETPVDEQRTRKFRPVRPVEPDEDDDEGDEGDDYDDEGDTPAPAVRKLFGFFRSARKDVKDDDDYDDAEDEDEDEDDDERASDRSKRFSRSARDDDDDYDDYDDYDDEDEPVRRYGRGEKRGAMRVYRDEDLGDEDEDDYDPDDYDYDDDVDYDDEDDHFERIGFGKRVLRFFKGVLIIALVLLLAAITLRQLEANERISLNWLRASLGTVVPLEGVFPTPAPTPIAELETESTPTPDDAQAALAPIETVEPTPAPEPTPEPYEGISIGGTPSATARVEFVDEDLEALE